MKKWWTHPNGWLKMVTVDLILSLFWWHRKYLIWFLLLTNKHQVLSVWYWWKFNGENGIHTFYCYLNIRLRKYLQFLWGLGCFRNKISLPRFLGVFIFISPFDFCYISFLIPFDSFNLIGFSYFLFNINFIDMWI